MSVTELPTFLWNVVIVMYLGLFRSKTAIHRTDCFDLAEASFEKAFYLLSL